MCSSDLEVPTSWSQLATDIMVSKYFRKAGVPQIDEQGGITLHVHPAISEVKQEDTQVSISTQTQFNLPLAASTIRESDTVVRARNGQVVVIGGLMQELSQDDLSSTPFLGDLPLIGYMFRHTRKVSSKTELVILLRPVVVESQRAWSTQLQQAQQRFQDVRHMNLP